MRSRAVAIFNTIITVVGPLLGPPLIGAAVDWSGDPTTIGMALSGFVFMIGLPTLLIVVFGLRHYRAAADEMAAVSRGIDGAALADSAGAAPATA